MSILKHHTIHRTPIVVSRFSQEHQEIEDIIFMMKLLFFDVVAYINELKYIENCLLFISIMYHQ